MKGDDIAQRLLDFGVDALRVAGRLPMRGPGGHVSSQLARSATAAGANYEEARSASSRADFIHKVRLAAKEIAEARYWLTLVVRAEMVSDDLARELQEARELAAILSASARTARTGPG